MAKRTTTKPSEKKKSKKGGKKATVVQTRRNRPLRDLTEEALRKYFKDLNGHKPAALYDLVLGEVEPPLLITVLEHTQGNQSRAAATSRPRSSARSLLRSRPASRAAHQPGGRIRSRSRIGLPAPSSPSNRPAS